MRPFLPVICVAFAFGGDAAGQDAHGFGPVTPVELPDVMATRHDGARVRLRDQFAGRRTAVQFVFVDCTTACPLLGSLFRKVDKGSEAQLVSITVNPERDTAARLAEWLGKFHASSRWVGLRVDASDLPAVLRAFKQETGPPSGHTLQVFLVDEKARYVARTTELPSAAAVAAELRLEAGRVNSTEQPLPGAGALPGRDIFDGRGSVIGVIGADRLESHASRCAGCHGASGKGGGEGRTLVPALTKDSLTAMRARRGGPPSAYNEQSFCEGLRTGVDPAGVQYASLMPRYRIDGRSCRQLWSFLTGVQ
jgi:cytochrome oxidase Cu insertion factor (SCO1/SenC/PrrC family)